MKILIAGSNGMIGSAVAAYLASQGHEVNRLVR
jgi:nucleoside-diphosphate-sugar epimerase